ncbi:MAG TPA: site-specific DNA-methyltransferase, partial [Chthoniobacterales bacterium]
MARGKGKNGGNGHTKKRAIDRYEHTDKKRINNPPVGLVTPETDPPLPTHKAYDYIEPVPSVKPGKNLDYDPHLDPQLVWAGKKEHASFEVPTVSLHVHETIDPRTIIEAVRKRNGNGLPTQPSLFERPEEKMPLRDAIEFYRHAHGWSNRLIAGDSLLVMNSLLEKEGMAGQVQMVYIDPPYGIKYGSNFQPFVNKRDVKDGKDEDLTQEPEMIQAFRDTWELGIHSYLTYLRDRLLLARELLSESGSVFVQISDENVQHVRELLSELFGRENFIVSIVLKKKGGQKSGMFDPINDYILWTTKDKEAAKNKFRKLFVPIRDEELGEVFRYVELPDRREITLIQLSDETGFDYRRFPRRIETDFKGAKLFSSENLTSGGLRRTQSVPYTYNSVQYDPGIAKGNCWKHSAITDDGGPSGLDRLAAAGRLFAAEKQLRLKRYATDFGYSPITNLWDEFAGVSNPIYVVQTTERAVQRCILMTTDPGDLVLDPTCGSGTTAYVAEQWGRRWITCDTSRVAISVAKQRLMTAEFDYYELAHPEEGISSGLRYEAVKHITSSTIANSEPPIEESLYDRPRVDNGRVRVTGPLTVEAVPAPTVRSLEGIEGDAAATRAASGKSQQSMSDFRDAATPLLDASVARKGATLRHTEWRDELLRTGLRGKGGHHID